MDIRCYVVGPVQTNCYFLIHGETNETLVVDPGDEASLLEASLRQQGLSPKAILLTHGHFDHVGAAASLSEVFSIPVYAHEAEQETLENPEGNRSGFFGRSPERYHADRFLSDGQECTLAGLSFSVLHTPGHTPGGCCFYFPTENILLSGDTLFCESVGRTDFPGGSMTRLVRCITEKLLVLPEETRVFPGHGPETDIGHEKRHNPFLWG